jgi:2'-5' RNA ligase
LRHAQGLTGTPVSLDRLHVTLAIVGNFMTSVPDYVVDNAIVAARRIVLPPVPVIFERVLTFPQSRALVLRSTHDTDARIAPLRQWLTWELRKVGLHPEQRSTPHMTILYHSTAISVQAIKPISWTATRFALILSHIGRHHHEWMGEWTFKDLPSA